RTLVGRGARFKRSCIGWLAGLRMADPLGPPTLAASRAVIFATFGRHFLRHLGQGVAELHRRSSHVAKRQRTMRVPIVRRETEDEVSRDGSVRRMANAQA